MELVSNGTSYGMVISLDVHINARIKTYQAVDIIPGREYTEEKDRYLIGRAFEKEEK